MTGDITILDQSAMQGLGALKYISAASATGINPGEPVSVALGAVQQVAAMATNKPVVATDFLVGIAATTSTHTSGAVGEVYCYPINPSTVFLIVPKVPTSWDTQAEYDALVGARVLLDLTTGTYTILATDGATNGCVIRPLDISKYPGKVAFSFRAAVSVYA